MSKRKPAGSVEFGMTLDRLNSNHEANWLHPGLMLALTVVSLGLNAVLAIWLFRIISGPLRSGAGTRGESRTLSRVERSIPVAKAELMTNAPPFHWRQIESGSYPEYIARLRAVGCPESVIRDMISADLVQAYKARAVAIWSRPPRAYWRKPSDNDAPNLQQMRQLSELDKERQQVQTAILGSAVSQQGLIDLAFLQVHGAEHSLAWLPEDKRLAAMAALEKSGYLAEEERQMLAGNDGSSLERTQKLQRQQLTALEGTLSADELKELRMRASQEAGGLRGELRFFDATQQEFDAVLKVRENLANDKTVPRDFYARKAVECAALKTVLGPERAAEYERNTDLFYVWTRQAAEHYGLDDGLATQAWELKRNTLAAADEIRRDAALDEAEKKRRLTELKKTAEQRLDESLGTAAARFARKGDGAWLSILAQRTQP